LGKPEITWLSCGSMLGVKEKKKIETSRKGAKRSCQKSKRESQGAQKKASFMTRRSSKGTQGHH